MIEMKDTMVRPEKKKMHGCVLSALQLCSCQTRRENRESRRRKSEGKCRYYCGWASHLQQGLGGAWQA